MSVKNWLPAAAVAIACLGTQALLAQAVTREEAAHRLRRTTFGPTSADLNAITNETQWQNWLNAQLAAPTSGYSPSAQVYMNLFPSEPLTSPPYGALPFPPPVPPPAFPPNPNHQWSREMLQNKQLVLALTSEYQLREVMTQFWEIHFTTGINKVKATSGGSEQATVYYEWHENRGFRQRALGTFASLLAWSMDSAAMRFYLDANTNCFDPSRGPNENYAREVVELHTLGPGPTNAPHYSNDVDIPAITKILSGLIVNPDGTPRYLVQCHNFDAKSVFVGSPVPDFNMPALTGSLQTADNIRREVEAFRKHLVDSPQTHEFVCTKLIQFFVGDHVPVDPTLLTDCVGAWGAEGDIQAILREIFDSSQFKNGASAPLWSRVSLPVARVLAPARILEASLGSPSDIIGLNRRFTRARNALGKMGAIPFEFPSPDGYPLESDAQIGTAVTWIYGEYAGRLYEDAVGTQQDRNRNFIYDPVPVLQTEVTRLGLQWNNSNDVALAALTLQFHNRFSSTDLSFAEGFLLRTAATSAPGTWPVTGPNAAIEEDHRVRLMLAFVNTLAQASEK